MGKLQPENIPLMLILDNAETFWIMAAPRIHIARDYSWH